MKKFIALTAALILLSGCNFLQSSNVTDEEKAKPESKEPFAREQVNIDYDNSLIAFKGGKGGVIKHEGKFEKFTVDVMLDAAEPTNIEKAKIATKIDITSMSTDNQKVTDHLLNEDFFASETYPEAQFVSSSITKKDGNSYAVTGDLTLKDTTKPVTLNAEITHDGVYCEHDLDSHNFGIGNENGTDQIVPMTFKLLFK